jgi:hypothetical protein
MLAVYCLNPLTSSFPLPITDWPEPGDGSEKDLAAYWQEDWDNGKKVLVRVFINFCRCSCCSRAAIQF